VWQTGNCIVRVLTLGRETKPDISCEWNTKFPIISEISTNRVHSKRIPKFSKTFPGIFYRSIQFRTGNLGIFGRMESAPRSIAWRREFCLRLAMAWVPVIESVGRLLSLLMRHLANFVVRPVFNLRYLLRKISPRGLVENNRIGAKERVRALSN